MAETNPRILVRGGRLSFSHIDEMWSYDGMQKPAYVATIILDDEEAAATQQQVRDVCTALVKERWPSQDIRKMGIKICLRSGTEKSHVAGYGEGVHFINTKCDDPPTIKDRRGRNVAKGSPSYPYDGCYVSLLVDLWIQDNKHGKRVNAELRGVQFIADGEAFSGGGRPVADDEFDNLDDDDEGSTEDDDEVDLFA